MHASAESVAERLWLRDVYAGGCAGEAGDGIARVVVPAGGCSAVAGGDGYRTAAVSCAAGACADGAWGDAARDVSRAWRMGMAGWRSICRAMMRRSASTRPAGWCAGARARDSADCRRGFVRSMWCRFGSGARSALHLEKQHGAWAARWRGEVSGEGWRRRWRYGLLRRSSRMSRRRET